MLDVVVELVHLLTPAVAELAPGLALPDAHADFPQLRSGVQRQLPAAEQGPRGLHRAVQVAGVDGVYGHALEALRQGVYLFPAALGDLAVPVALGPAEEVPLGLGVANEVYGGHFPSPPCV